MDVPQDVVLPQETVALSGSREGQESSCNSADCDSHSSAAGQLLGGNCSGIPAEIFYFILLTGSSLQELLE